MPTLTEEQMNEAEYELNNNGVAAFYDYLAAKGDKYAALGAAVTRNDTWQGELANKYAEHAAEDDAVDMSYGSPDWLNLNMDIATAYMAAYRDNQGVTPDRDEVQDIHNFEYDEAGLDPDDWFPNKPLNDSGDPDALWADYMTNEGAGDLLGDAADVIASGGKFLFGPYLLYKAIKDGSLNEAEMEFAEK